MHRLIQSQPKDTDSAEQMICVNASSDSNDSNDSAVSFSPPTMPSSPVKSLAIQQLLESPILNHSSQTRTNSQTSQTSETNSDEVNNDFYVKNRVTGSTPDTTPDTTPDGSQIDSYSDPLAIYAAAEAEAEAEAEQPMETSNPSIDFEAMATTPNGGRNSFRRQPSVCLKITETKMTSSPRALAILKNAIKTSLTSNRICDKLDVKFDNSKSVTDFSAVNGIHSPPNKSFKSSPLSRGSALLRAAKERLEKQESQRSPKISCNLFKMSNETTLDRQLTSILRKRELQSSPTNSEHKAKKKKVLFAEPVVSSQLEFRPSPSHTSLLCDHSTLQSDTTDKEVEDLTNNEKKRNNLVHQNSTFDKEFDDITYDFRVHESPVLFTQQLLDEEPVVPTLKETLESETVVDEERLLSSPELVQDDKKEEEDQDSDDLLIGVQGSQESIDDFQCSQVMPSQTDFCRLSPQLSQTNENLINQREDTDDSFDPIVHIPMRLSLLKELYNVFGNVIREYAPQTSAGADS